MDLTELLKQAGEGDQSAWNAVVARFGGLVWSVARAHRLTADDAADVVQTTWLRLVENLERIAEPERVGSWLATTARRECLRVLRTGRRVLPADGAVLEAVAEEPDLGRAVFRSDRDDALWQAFSHLSGRCRELLRLLMSDPPPSYREVGAALDMPVGSIGPTRERCLARLRDQIEPLGITRETGPSYD